MPPNHFLGFAARAGPKKKGTEIKVRPAAGAVIGRYHLLQSRFPIKKPVVVLLMQFPQFRAAL